MEVAENRKRSPRAPSLSLNDAVEKALKVYEAEGKHPAPADVVAKHIGYKSPSSGSAATALASLRYYGLLDRPKEGFLAASRDVEAFKFSPDDAVKSNLLIKWLKTPPLFAELLSNYPENLPSDSTLKFDLIRRGFNPATADECVSAFRDSVNYARYYDQAKKSPDTDAEAAEVNYAPPDQSQATRNSLPGPIREAMESEADRIPIRLKGGRRAWLIIPSPFYESDKKRLNAHIDLLLTDTEPESE